MKYKGSKTSQISFPLGGIGAGCIGLSGTGRLIDWEIYNHASKGSANGNTHFAVRAEKDGKVIDFRVLNGDLPPPYQGVTAEGFTGKFRGVGFGPDYSLMCGWPHFRESAFNGEYPVATLDFADPRFPGQAKLTAWSPFIPGESRASSMPAACFEIEIANTTGEELCYSCIGVLANPWAQKTHFNQVEGRTLTCFSGLGADDLARGDLSLSVIDGEGDFSCQTYWYRGGWCDARETYFRDAMRGGDFNDRRYEGESGFADHGLVCLRFPLAPGERRITRFTLTWNIPERKNDWNEWAAKRAAELGIPNRWRNYYATQWADSRASAAELAAHFGELRAKTFAFRDALFSSTLPPAVIDGVSANLSTLATPTCLRLEDGTFYGWEGVGQGWGSCEGSCTHVWNYQQTLPFLFPDLERSMREANLRFGLDENGASHFRVNLPLGIKATPEMFRACADGQFGDVMKSYRDWKISGDDAWLRRWWPSLRAMIEYAWSPKNPDKWDPEQAGVLTGRQHHTLDMELFGPNAWLTAHYLGALRAGAEMARAAGDEAFAAKCEAIFEKGADYADKNLFEDGHFIQRVNLADKSVTDAFDASRDYWNDEAGEIKYQIGAGCGIDGALGQFYASLYGIGDVLDPAKVKAHLLSVFERNFIPHMRDFFNPWRNYTVNDEGGVAICTWDDATRPAIPIPYNTETMNGFEWAYAAHLALVGLTEKATAVADAIRNRYDGEKRNPWNEIECGSNYARSMAAYALIPAWSGFTFDMAKGEVGFSPRTEGDFRTFWSVGSAWGTFTVSGPGRTCALEVLHGRLGLKVLRLGFEVREATFNGEPLRRGEGGAWQVAG